MSLADRGEPGRRRNLAHAVRRRMDASIDGELDRPGGARRRSFDLAIGTVDHGELCAGDPEVRIAAGLDHAYVSEAGVAVDRVCRQRRFVVSQRHVVLGAEIVAEESQPEDGGLGGERGGPQLGLDRPRPRTGDALRVGQRNIVPRRAGVERRPSGETRHSARRSLRRIRTMDQGRGRCSSADRARPEDGGVGARMGR